MGPVAQGVAGDSFTFPGLGAGGSPEAKAECADAWRARR